ncbi:MAG: Crp/Fnr family transcriptional regulator [Lewinellaceae bacterium]|nr:Crp/Fnr family transcriptional regulator [Lewinellaceae bacterium]
MCINPDLLFDYGAVRKKYHRQDVIFQEGNMPFYYFQIEEGLVKMVNAGIEHDFIQGIFTEGESFGEPPLLCEKPYPAAAVAITDVSVIALPRKHFINLLQQHFEVHLGFSACLAERITYKAQLLRDLNFDQPEVRILATIDLLKRKLSREKYCQDEHFVVPFTRQDLADLTGLRVETVIRKIGQLEQKGQLRINNRKIHRPYLEKQPC